MQSAAQSQARTHTRTLAHDAAFLVLVAVYYVVHAILRLWVSPSLELDEAALIVTGEALRLGYGPQFPVYDWLQWGVFQIGGRNLASIVWLKAAVLWASVACVYGALRSVVPPLWAGVAAATLLFVPEFAWEAQRTLAHTVAVIGASAATMAVLTRLVLRGGATGLYLLLGAVLAFGILSKANFWFALLGWGLAILSLPEVRQRLSGRGVLLACGLALAAAAAPYAWMLGNLDLSLSSVDKFTRNEAGGLPGWLTALGASVTQMIAGLALAGLVLAALWLVGRRAGPVEADSDLALAVRLHLRAGAIGLALFVLSMVAFQSTHVTPRWMLPMFMMLVPWGAVWLLARAGGRGAKGLALVSVVLALVMWVAQPGARLMAPSNISPDYDGLLAALAPFDLGDAALDGPRNVVGNLIARDAAQYVTIDAPGAAARPGRVLLARREAGLNARLETYATEGWSETARAEILYDDRVDGNRSYSIFALRMERAP